MEIRGKVAFVSGANRGLGKCFAKLLLEAGASKVYGAARDISSITDHGVEAVQLDITDPVSVRNAAARCQDTDLLFNNSGYLKYGPLLAMGGVTSLREHLETNTIGTLIMAQAFAPILRNNGGGAMINILSVLSWLNILESGPYSASKAGQWSLTNGLRNELRSQGTTVIGVHPGYIDTDMAAGVEGPKSTPEEVVRKTLEALINNTEEVIINDVGHWIKETMSSQNPAYIQPLS